MCLSEWRHELSGGRECRREWFSVFEFISILTIKRNFFFNTQVVFFVCFLQAWFGPLLSWHRVLQADMPSCCQTHTDCELFGGGGWFRFRRGGEL